MPMQRHGLIHYRPAALSAQAGFLFSQSWRTCAGVRGGTMFRELLHTLIDAVRTGDLSGHLRAWLQIVRGQVIVDLQPGDPPLLVFTDDLEWWE